LTGSIIITALPIATFTYPASAYCILSNPLFPNSIKPGPEILLPQLSITSATGLINPAASTPGTYMVTNTIPAAGCPAVMINTVRIDPVLLAENSFGAAGRLLSICQNPSSGYAVPLTLSGIVYTSNGIMNKCGNILVCNSRWFRYFTGTIISGGIENILNAQNYLMVIYNL
jgi:hypothetical protein